MAQAMVLDLDPMERIARLLRESGRGANWRDGRVEAIGRAMRHWALDIAVQVADGAAVDIDKKEGLDPTLASRLIAAYRAEIEADDDMHDETAIEELNREVSDAMLSLCIHEAYTIHRPRYAAAREAMAVLRAAALDPMISIDLRAMAIRLAAVPEHAALAIAYQMVDMRANREKTPQRDLDYFYVCGDGRIDALIEEVRRDLGERWLKMLEERFAGKAPTALASAPTQPAPDSLN